MRLKEYLQFGSLWRSLCDLRSPADQKTRTQASPALAFTAVVLAFFLAILLVDAHRGQLHSLGLLASENSVEAILLSP